MMFDSCGPLCMVLMLWMSIGESTQEHQFAKIGDHSVRIPLHVSLQIDDN